MSMRKDVYERMRYFVLEKIKPNYSAVARQEACRQGVRTLFINCHELILRLKSAQEKQHLERVMRWYERYDLLIIDELGYLPISVNESKLLFQLINGRYERKSTIITTNVPLSSWGTVLKPPKSYIFKPP